MSLLADLQKIAAFLPYEPNAEADAAHDRLRAHLDSLPSETRLIDRNAIIEECAMVAEKYRWPPEATTDDLWLRGALDTCTKLAGMIRHLKLRSEGLTPSPAGATAYRATVKFDDGTRVIEGSIPSATRENEGRCDICKQEIEEFNSGVEAWRAGVAFNDLPDMPMDQNGVGWAWAAWNGKQFVRPSLAEKQLAEDVLRCIPADWKPNVARDYSNLGPILAEYIDDLRAASTPSPLAGNDAATYKLIDAITAMVEQNGGALVNLPGWDALSLAFHEHPAAQVDVSQRTAPAQQEKPHG